MNSSRKPERNQRFFRGDFEGSGSLLSLNNRSTVEYVLSVREEVRRDVNQPSEL